MTLTVSEKCNQGIYLCEAQDKINEILEESKLSILNKIILMELMVFGMKLRAWERNMI